MTKTTIAYIVGALLILAVVVGVLEHQIASVSYQAPVAGSINPSGGDVIQSITTQVNGVVIGAKFMQWVPLVLPLGTNQVSWHNTTGQVAYVAGGRFTLASTTSAGQAIASSSMILSVGTSTTATITDSPTIFGGLVNQVQIATSTTAFDAGSQIVLSGQGKTANSATSTIAVAPGEYLVETLEQANQGCVNAGSCEAATSSKRGYVLNGIVEYSF